MEALPRRALGQTDIRCTPLGFGSYRASSRSSVHRAALEAYLDRGGNLIDTSSNYGGGDSERLIGEVLQRRPPDAAVVITKAGYIQGQAKMAALQQDTPEIVRYAPDVWHCIHPEFLAAQLETSLERLRRSSVDVFLLHNPEYFLLDRHRRGTIGPGDREEFHARIQRAFAFLEEAASDGRIRWYGVSSNRFAASPRDPTATSVERMLDAARAIDRDHHFRVVQLPCNLYESDAVLEPVCARAGRTVLEFCREQGLGVLVNRPLNAVIGDRLIRLADSVAPQAADPPLGELVRRLRESEANFSRRFDFPLMNGGKGLAGWLAPGLVTIDSAEAFRSIVHQAVVPAMNTWLANADRALAAEADYRPWRDEFTTRLSDLFRNVELRIVRAQAEMAAQIRDRLIQSGLRDPGRPLSQIALALLLAQEGIGAVLNGMRTPGYVADSLASLELDLADAHRVLAAFREVA
jgi:aryl-alcohol dehydrogenase-like predicted oxidoreductase